MLPTVPAPIDTKYAAQPQVNVQSPNRLQTHTNTVLLLLQRWMLLATEWIWSKQMAMLGGTSPVQAGAPQADDGAMWFRPATAARTTVGGVGLDMVLWERMRWEVRGGEGRPVGCGHRQWRRVSDLLFKWWC